MQLSVVMSVYNETIKEIDECIESILNQSYKNFEFIIVDDNPSSTIIKKFLLDKSNKDKRIRILFNKSNMGLIASINKGIACANSDIIARMDADDVANKDRFNKQMSFMEDNNLDFVCANFSTISTDGCLLEESLYSNKTQSNQSKIKNVMSYCSIANGPSFCFKKEVFYKNDGYRNLCVDDYDFAVRALINNYRLGYQKDCLIYKRERTNSISAQNSLKQYIYVAAISKFLRKNNFEQNIPLEYLTDQLNEVSKKSFNKFKLFSKYRYLYKQKKGIKYLFKLLIIIFSSKIIFERFLWTHLINGKQERFM